MTERNPQAPDGIVSRRNVAITALVVVLTIMVIILSWQLITLPRRLAGGLAEKAVGKKETQVDITTVVTQVRGLSRLETAHMQVVNVSTTKQSYGVLPQAVAGDQLTFMAVGDVIAGVDLSKLTRDDVKLAADDTLVITLPRPEVLVTRVDNTKSKVLDRSTGMLRRGDTQLESRARAHAETAIRNEALNKGILDLAQNNAEKKLADFILKLGAKSVRFDRGTPMRGPRG